MDLEPQKKLVLGAIVAVIAAIVILRQVEPPPETGPKTSEVPADSGGEEPAAP